MGFIRFCNQPTIYEAKVSPVSTNIVCIEFKKEDVVKNDSGFLFSVKDDMSVVHGDYSRFTTIYQVTDDALYLSSDGTVFPVIPTEKTEPTTKERIQTLERQNEELTNLINIILGVND